MTYKILVLGVQQEDPARLLDDDRLENVRRLMDAGIYGRLETGSATDNRSLWIALTTSLAPESTGDPLSIQEPTLGDHLVKAGKRSIVLGDAPGAIGSTSHEPWRVVRQFLETESWDCLQAFESAQQTGREGGRDNPQFDDELGQVLERLDGETIVLVVSLPSPRPVEAGPGEPPRGAFVLASSNCPPAGEVEKTRLIDLAPTLLDLAEFDVPSTMQGRSILADLADRLGSGQGGYAEDEEALVRARLSGLGYLA
ncbi:hypothetical protein BH23PLA1_BH23PLA1_06640 [soil metagenome]